VRLPLFKYAGTLPAGDGTSDSDVQEEKL